MSDYDRNVAARGFGAARAIAIDAGLLDAAGIPQRERSTASGTPPQDMHRVILGQQALQEPPPNRIVVELPGVKDPAAAEALIQRTAVLKFLAIP